MPAKEWRSINDLYFRQPETTTKTKPVDYDTTPMQQKDEPEVRLSDGTFLPGDDGYQFNKKCKVRVKVEYLKETSRKKVTFKLFCVYSNEEEDLAHQAEGFEENGFAEAEMTLFYGDTYSKALQNDPSAICRYKFKASHTKGEKEIESELLEMPHEEVLQVDFIEIADIHFHHNCALPCLDEEGELISSLLSSFSYTKENTDRELVVEGHSDRSGDEDYNLKISKRRAEAIKALLEDDDTMWKGVVDSDGKDQKIETEDYQQTLKSLSAKYGWPCDPGAVDNKSGPKTETGVKNFQTEYNTRFPKNEQLTVDGKLGPKSWQAIFYTLRDLLDKDLKSVKLDSLPKLTYGYPDGKGIYPCGESSPVTNQEKSKEDRRVELVFYKKGECTPVVVPAPGRKVEKKKDPVTEKGWEKKDIPKAEIKISYDMAELVEIVTQDKEKWVKGPGMETTDIAENIDRTDKDGSNYKQYINIDRDLEGTSKRHAEYGSEIIFKARIKQTNNNTDKIKDQSVKFVFKRTDGPNRTNPGGSTPDLWKVSSETVTGDFAEGFNKANGDKTVTVKTDGKGWTQPVSFFLSMFGGDQFEISASLAPSTPGEKGAKTLTTDSKYVVWRKFWYQMTYADGFNPPKPTKAEDAYKQVFAEMVRSSEKIFKKNDLPVDLRDRTFYKEYMLQKGGSNDIVATIGSNNKNEFAKKPLYDKDLPKEHLLKANLIICNYQCDAKPPCNEAIFKITLNGQQITMQQGSGGPIICKPPLKPGAKLVVKGEWSKKQSPWAKEGTITDDAIEIESTRGSTLTVKVDLSKGATGSPPTPTKLKPIFIKLKLETGRGYLGESFGTGQILCVYRPTAAPGKQGSEADYNDTVAHELGHMWNQTPVPTKQPSPLNNHPMQYVGHGGSGSHCRSGVTQYELETSYTSTVEPETTIAKAATTATDTHEVASTANFIKNYKVKINGVEKTIKDVVNSKKLKFTTSFTAAVGDKVKQIVDWNDRSPDYPAPDSGECLMFHSYSSKCKHVFCAICKSYLQLQDMSKL